MGAPQKYATRREQTRAIIEAVFAEPVEDILAELVRRGHLVYVGNGTYRVVAYEQ